MKPRPLDPVMVAILAESGVAREVARLYRVPARDLEDVEQEALAVIVRAVQRGAFVPSDDMGDMRARARQYLVIVARNLACANWRKRQRLDLPGELPAVGVDLLPYLEARSSLRRVPMPAYLRPLLAALAGGDTIAEYARTRGILRATLYGRLRALRKKLRRK